MTITPEIIYEKIRNNNISKPDAISQLNVLIENVDDEDTRRDSINVFNKIDCKSQEMFGILENLLISDSNVNIRNIAAILMYQKFPNKGLNPLLWALQHECNYTSLITILLILADINNYTVKSTLLDRIRKIDIGDFDLPLVSKFREGKLNNFSIRDLIDILINYTTIFFLKEKYSLLKYAIKDGIVTELDFSNVNNKIIDWRYREDIQDLSEINGIFYLKKITKVKLFSLNWAVKHEFSLNCLIELVKILEKINNNETRNVFISEIEKLKENRFKNEIEDVILENLSNLKLAKILLNLISITFLKLKYPKLIYEIKKGEIIKLNLEGIKVVTLPNCIRYLTSLTILNLRNCSLYIIPDFLADLKVLKKINLELNNIEIIPNSLTSLKSLKCLNINKNRLKILPFQLFNLLHLEHLSIENNMVREIPHFVGKIYSLKFLNLSSNQLKNIPESIRLLKNLQFLNLSSNKLKEIPSSIWMLHSLKDLNIENNELEQIPGFLGSCSALINLNLECNILKKLPESLGFLNSLENLRLGWNKLIKLPKSIGMLSSLKSLALENNSMIHIPKAICSLPFIEDINFSYNDIKELPKEFGRMKSLKILNLYYNQLTSLPYTLKILAPLKKLNLKVNNLIQ